MHLVKIVLTALVGGVLISVGMVNLATDHPPNLTAAWVSMVFVGTFLAALTPHRLFRARNHAREEPILPTAEPEKGLYESLVQLVNPEALIQFVDTLLSSGIIRTNLTIGSHEKQVGILRRATPSHAEYTLTVTTTEQLIPKNGDPCEGELRTTEQFMFNTHELGVQRTVFHICLPTPDMPLRLSRDEYPYNKVLEMEHRRQFEVQFEYANKSEVNILLGLLRETAHQHGVILDG